LPGYASLIRLRAIRTPRYDTPAAIRLVEYHGEDVQSGGMAAMLRTMTVTDLDKNAQSISVVGLNETGDDLWTTYPVDVRARKSCAPA
jgi:hypothetical protein